MQTGSGWDRDLGDQRLEGSGHWKGGEGGKVDEKDKVVFEDASVDSVEMDWR